MCNLILICTLRCPLINFYQQSPIQSHVTNFNIFVLSSTIRNWQVNPLLHIYSFSHIEEKSFRKTLLKKVKLPKMSNFTFFHNVFYSTCMLNSFNSHISVVVCSFFELRTVSAWCIREWVKGYLSRNIICTFCSYDVISKSFRSRVV